MKKKQPAPKGMIRKIYSIYRSLGLDTSDMEEDEKERLLEYYSENPNKLKEDYEKSKKNKDKFEEHELL